MVTELADAVRETILSAARKLTGFLRRQFQAEVAGKYCQGSARQAEQLFGWGRDAVETGLNELRSGIRCLDHFSARGRHKSEQLDPMLVDRIRVIVEPQSQADPKFQNPLAFTRVTAKAVREQLQAENASTSPTATSLPAERTLYDILNRLGYSLRRVRKTKPKKKFPRLTLSSTT
jgi:transposase